MVYHIEAVQWLPAPLEKVFLFFSDPKNLPRISPPSAAARLERVELIAPSAPVPSESGHSLVDTVELAGAGSELLVSFRVTRFRPLRLLWRARIAEFEWWKFFSDIQLEGPFRRWTHRHEFAREARGELDGTLVRDWIEYEPGLCLLDAAADLLVVRPSIRSMLRARHRLSAQLIEV